MKNYIKKIKEQSWRKTAARLIICGTVVFFSLFLLTIVLFIGFLMACALWESYKLTPSSFHYLLGFLVMVGTWMYLYDWADKQDEKSN